MPATSRSDQRRAEYEEEGDQRRADPLFGIAYKLDVIDIRSRPARLLELCIAAVRNLSYTGP